MIIFCLGCTGIDAEVYWDLTTIISLKEKNTAYWFSFWIFRDIGHIARAVRFLPRTENGACWLQEEGVEPWKWGNLDGHLPFPAHRIILSQDLNQLSFYITNLIPLGKDSNSNKSHPKAPKAWTAQSWTRAPLPPSPKLLLEGDTSRGAPIPRLMLGAAAWPSHQVMSPLSGFPALLGTQA